MTANDASTRPNGHSTTMGAVKESNGTVAAKQNGSHAIDLQIWKRLVQCLPPRTADCDFWWMLTGRHLAVMLEEAGASVGEQYAALTFHYHWVIPRMGPKPGVDGVIPGRWKSLLQADGTPIEYSWKWNTSRGRPAIRYAMEPIGEHAGTELDPLNQQATRQALHQLSQAFPETNLEWTNHFFSTLFDHDNTKLAQEDAAGAKLTTSTGIGVDFGANGMAFKTYFQGRKLNQPGFMPLEDWIAAMQPLLSEKGEMGTEGALGAFQDFLSSNPHGQPLRPFSLAVDCVSPEKSRLKLYMNTPRTSFASVRAVMTLGGRFSGDLVEKQLRDIRELLYAVLAVPEDFPDDAEIEQTYHRKALLAETASAAPGTGPGTSRRRSSGSSNGTKTPPPAHTPGFVYYFDVAKGQALPKVKFNIPVRSYGRDELSTAKAVVDFMEARGRGAYGASFLRALEGLASGMGGSASKALDQTRGLQSFIGLDLSSSGELGVTSYMAVRGSDAIDGLERAESSYFKPIRGTRRRDESY
ncbi:dimethylallyl tryptophan synthase GliD1 [Xylaria longipes]|nr:dimethylallyl tryptophan synthase GliD1 [Xylaria longipes]